MNRAEFLKTLGFSALAVAAVGTISACGKDGVVTPTGPVDFTLDLSAATNSALANANGYVISNGVVVAKTAAGAFVAATQLCSHEPKKKVTFLNGQFFCTEHGAKFDTTGKGLNSEASNGLTVYKTTLTGTSLRVYS
jgi:cytochrome b6-f complex iron-sulfur subunit